jgi:hypothetical protein
MDQAVFRMSGEHEQQHLDKIQKNLKRLEAAKRDAIDSKTSKTNKDNLIMSLRVRIKDIKREYEFFKGEYGL